MLRSIFVAANMQHNIQQFNIQTNYKGKVQEKAVTSVFHYIKKVYRRMR